MPIKFQKCLVCRIEGHLNELNWSVIVQSQNCSSAGLQSGSLVMLVCLHNLHLQSFAAFAKGQLRKTNSLSVLGWQFTSHQVCFTLDANFIIFGVSKDREYKFFLHHWLLLFTWQPGFPPPTVMLSFCFRLVSSSHTAYALRENGCYSCCITIFFKMTYCSGSQTFQL